jgi:hypothetical protein
VTSARTLAGAGFDGASILGAVGNPPATMFVFFSNRLGCFGSLLVSVLLTVVLLLILGVL